MRFDLITIFPEFFGGPLDYGIVRRAREAKLIETHIHDLRDFTHDRPPWVQLLGLIGLPSHLFDEFIIHA